MTEGRAAWNVVTSINDNEARNMGREKHMAHDERYDQADEFVEIVLGHWGSWDDDAVLATIAACRDPELRAELVAQSDPARRAMDTLFYLNYFPTRFTGEHLIYRQRHERRPLLSLPFGEADFVGIVLPDK